MQKTHGSKAFSDDYASKLETTPNEKAAKGAGPLLTTGKSEGESILRARLEEAFATPYKESIVKSSAVFENPDDYYIIDYNGAEKYAKGHIPKAVQYDPNSSLSSATDLLSIPTDKRILVYGPTGSGNSVCSSLP